MEVQYRCSPFRWDSDALGPPPDLISTFRPSLVEKHPTGQSTPDQDIRAIAQNPSYAGAGASSFSLPSFWCPTHIAAILRK